MKKLKVGLYGTNGHQIHEHLADHPLAEVVAVAAFNGTDLKIDCERHDELDALLANQEIDLISLCSPMRQKQAVDAIRCLSAGKHVYAEKPSALEEEDLDAIMETSRHTGCAFHEMAGTIVQRPYRQMRKAIQEGQVGKVVQVLIQKSYPWTDWRPSNENKDGGLSTQVGIYAARFVEHIAGVKICDFQLKETKFGNPDEGSQCRFAASIVMRLGNGGLASAVCNYMNPMSERCWGYERLSVFGTEGIIESNTEGPSLRLIRGTEEPQDIDLSEPTSNYFDLYVDHLLNETPMPLCLEDELKPTRWVIRAKQRLGYFGG